MLGFSGVNIVSDPGDARNWHREGCKQFWATCLRSKRLSRLRPFELKQFEALIGLQPAPRNCFGSEMAIRRALVDVLIGEVRRMVAEHPLRRFFLVTLINDSWGTFERLPMLNLGAMKAAIPPVMGRANFDGWLGFVELQTIDHALAGWGRLITPHFHAMAWYDDPNIDHEDAEAAMCRSTRLSSRIRARTAVITPWTDTSIFNLVAYLLKAPVVAKYAVPDKNSPSSFHYEDCRLKPGSAARLFEMLSKVEIDELMMCSGGGKLLRSAILERIARVGRRSGVTLSDVDADRIWRRCRSSRRKDQHAPIIFRQRDVLADDRRLELMSLWLMQRQYGVRASDELLAGH